MPYQTTLEEQRKRKAAGAQQPIAAPPQLAGPGKTPVRQFGDAAAATARGISGAVGSMTVGPLTDLTRGAVALATGNDPRSRPGGAFSTTAAFNQQAQDAQQQVFGGTGQAIQDFGGALTGTQPFKPSPVAPAANDAGTVVVPPGTRASLQKPQQPASQPVRPAVQPVAEQSIAALPKQQFDGQADTQKFLADRARSRDANLTKRDAQIDASVANARNTELRNSLQSQLNRTKPGGVQRSGFRPRGGTVDPRDQLIAQITALNNPVAAAATPSVADQQKDAAAIDAAAAKAQADKVTLEGGQLALQGEQRKAALQQQIAQLGADDPNADALRANLAAISGKNPNEGRFESIEEVVGTDAFGTPIKVRSLYDTRTGGFIDRGGQAQKASGPSSDEFVKAAKADPRNRGKSDDELKKFYETKYGKN